MKEPFTIIIRWRDVGMATATFTRCRELWAASNGLRFMQGDTTHFVNHSETVMISVIPEVDTK